MKTFVVLAGCFGALLLAGCSSTNQYVRLPNQGRSIDDPAKARIYVLRPETIEGTAKAEVADGQQIIGCTKPKGYLCWERPPGQTIITSMTLVTSHLEISVTAGQVYYLVQHVQPVWPSRSSLEAVDSEKGSSLLRTCDPPALSSPATGPGSGSRSPVGGMSQ